jgi:hypothetical protein
MITCNVQGGLANVMFQIAAMKSFAKDHNTEACFPNFSSQLDMINRDTHHNPKVTYAQEYATIFKNLNLRQDNIPATNNIVVPFMYCDIQFIDGASYSGFFQCERFFMHNRDMILDMYEPNDSIKEYIKGKYSELLSLKTCGIHVRRGDYLKLQHVHSVQGMEYFRLGIAAVGPVDKCVIFSDDIEWCKSNFIGPEFVFIENERDYVDLFLMSMCTHQIISNSSFSWWAAWLNKNPDKIVVGPLRWFNEQSIASKDILPETWTKIHV